MRFYLLGRGISHSRSPAIWNGVFEALALDSSYQLLDIEQNQLEEALQLLDEPDVKGFNVTMPYKGWAYEQADVRSQDAVRARGCNWLTREAGHVRVENTDIEGARMLFDATDRSESVLVLGAGRTAAAVLTALEGRADSVAVTNRTYERASGLADVASEWLKSVAVVPWEERGTQAERVDMIVNTTSVGMAGDEHSPLPDEVRLRRDARIYDMVYRGTPTPLARQAARLEIAMVDGLAHLEAQAVALLPHFGLPPDADRYVRASLEASVGHAPLRWAVPPLQ